MPRPQTLIFLGIDIPLGLAGRPARLIKIEFASDPLDESQLIITVQYLEVLR